MKRRRHSREQWLEWLLEQPQSGISIARFCETKGVGEQSFYLWRRKLKKELKRAQRAALKQANSSASSFVPVEIVSQVGLNPVAIELPCGATAKVPTDESSLRLVFRVLLELGGQS